MRFHLPLLALTIFRISQKPPQARVNIFFVWIKGFETGNVLKNVQAIFFFYMKWKCKVIHVLLFFHYMEKSSTLNISPFVLHKRKLSGFDTKFKWMTTEFPFLYERKSRTHVCLALALQYFLFLSGSLTWPFLQHWAHTNCIFRLTGPNLRRAGGSSYGIATSTI